MRVKALNSPLPSDGDILTGRKVLSTVRSDDLQNGRRLVRRRIGKQHHFVTHSAFVNNGKNVAYRLGRGGIAIQIESIVCTCINRNWRRLCSVGALPDNPEVR